MNVAAVDIGTNSVRLLVTDGTSELDRRVITTRLGQGVAATRRLHPDAVARTLACLAELRTALDDHGVAGVRAVATAVLRDVNDGDDFLAEAGPGARAPRSRCSTGRRRPCSASSAPPPSSNPSAGRSSSSTSGAARPSSRSASEHPEASVSLPVGSVRLTETQLLHDPPLPEELTNAIGLVEDHLDRRPPGRRRRWPMPARSSAWRAPS